MKILFCDTIATRSLLFGMVAMGVSPTVNAHGPMGHQEDPPFVGLQLNAGIATSFRTDAAISDDRDWQIPGLLMGGDAHAAEEGVVLDAASLHLVWNSESKTYAKIDMGSHHGVDVEFDEILVGYQISPNIAVEAGRMKGRFSPSIGHHAYARSFSEESLLLSAFYGGHFSDDGVRLLGSLQANITLGLELWRGEQFPATAVSGGGTQDIFMLWSPTLDNLRFKLGTWYQLAEPKQRIDDRVEEGHQHSNSGEEKADLNFTGDQNSAGVFVEAKWLAEAGWNAAMAVEFMQVDLEGILQDSTRIAELEGDYWGMRLEPSFTWNHHGIALRYERLHLDNHLVGPGGPGLAEKAELIAMKDDPTRYAVSYRYHLNDQVGVRLEWTKDKTTADSSNYIGIGITWSDTLWSSAQTPQR